MLRVMKVGEFNADGFGPPPDCDPKKKPTFDLKAPADAGPGTPSGGGGVEVEASVNVN